MASRRFTCTIECPRCTKTFKNSKSALQHMLKIHQLSGTSHVVEFRNHNNIALSLPKIVLLPTDCAQHESYKEWLATITERLNEALHPGLPGKIIDIPVTARELIHSHSQNVYHFWLTNSFEVFKF